MAFLTDVLLGSSLKTWLLVNLPITLAIYWVGWIIYARTLHPLAKIPGDFWPSVSRSWLMWRAHMGDIEHHQVALHKKYGPVVRVAPDEVMVSDPECIPRIYPLQSPNAKTDWYHPWRPSGLKSQPDLFTQTDEKAHSAYRRVVGGVYSLTNILKSEKQLDTTLNLFIERMGSFADRKEAFDFGNWLEMYAYDNIGEVFFGKAFGFVKDSIDYGGYIHAVHLAMPFLHVITMTPTYVRPFLLVGAAMVPSLLKAVLAVEDIKNTAIRETETAKARSADVTEKRADVISQLFAIAQNKGDKVNFTYREITSEMWVGIMAGADSTSILLRAVFYFLMKYPEKLDKVRAEVDAAFANGTLSSPVQHNDAVKLPYLMAVVRETNRLFPSFQVTMPRHAPSQGFDLCGMHIPAGYKAGMNPYIVQRSKSVFGEDADEFKPERWFDTEDRLRSYERAMIGFGAGTRQCTGRPLALAEVYKVAPEILHRFTFEMAHDQPWVTHNAAFNYQTGVECILKKRVVI